MFGLQNLLNAAFVLFVGENVLTLEPIANAFYNVAIFQVVKMFQTDFRLNLG